jgi:hypothetical protein
MSHERPGEGPGNAPAQPEPIAAPPTAPPAHASHVRRRTVVWIVLGTIAVTVGITWLVRTYVFPGAFRPVELSARETQTLDDKLAQITGETAQPAATAEVPVGTLEPERYREDAARRAVSFSERELNALLAHDPDLAQRVAIDLSNDLASVRLLVPMEPDFPLVGGRTLRIDAGLELAFRAGQPVAILRGVSIMGVPLPEAWLGNLKNVDLVREFGDDGGFWQAFAAGIEDVEIIDGALRVRLKE